MNKFNTLLATTLSLLAVTSAHARYQSSPDTSFNTLTSVRAATLAQFDRSQKVAPAPTQQRVLVTAAAPVVKPIAGSAMFAAPNLARAQGRATYLRALKRGDVAAASYDFGTAPGYERATR